MFSVKKTLAAGVVALGFMAGGAQAQFINGSVGLSDAGITLTGLPGTMVSALLNFTLGVAPTSGCTVNIAPDCPGSAPATNMTIPLAAPGAMSVTFDTGTFVWTFTQLVSITRTAPTNSGIGQVSDQIQLTAIGIVDDGAGGFSPTAALLAFGASGNCNEASPGSTSCAAGTATATWQATLSASGRNVVPEPTILALLGLGLAGLGLLRRKTA